MIRKQISRTGNLEFWHTLKNTEVENEIYEIANEVLSKKLFPGYLDSINEAIESNGEENTQLLSENEQLEVFKKTSPLSAHLYPYANAQNQWNVSSILGFSKVSDTGLVIDFLSKKYLLESLSINDIIFMWESQPFYATDGQPYFNLHVIKNTKSGIPYLNGKDIKSAKQSFDTLSRQPMVSIDFTNVGAAIWGDITEKSSYNETGIAIKIDNKVFSAPVDSERIDGGKTQITGGSFMGKDGINQAKIITSLLNLQKSPYRFVVINER